MMKGLKKQIEADNAPPPAPEAPGAKRAKEAKPSIREGKQMIAGYFSKPMATRIAITARLQGRSIQAFLGAALDAELQKAGEQPFGER